MGETIVAHRKSLEGVATNWDWEWWEDGVALGTERVQHFDVRQNFWTAVTPDGKKSKAVGGWAKGQGRSGCRNGQNLNQQSHLKLPWAELLKECRRNPVTQLSRGLAITAWFLSKQNCFLLQPQPIGGSCPIYTHFEPFTH